MLAGKKRKRQGSATPSHEGEEAPFSGKPFLLNFNGNLDAT